MSGSSFRGTAQPAADARRLASLGLGAAHLSALPAARAQDLEEGYAVALEHYKRQEHAQAYHICRQILLQYPDYSPARHMKMAIEQQMPPMAPFTAIFLYHKAYYEIGDYSYGVPSVQVDRPSSQPTKLYVGRFCSFAAGVMIMLGSEHQWDWLTTYPFPAPNFGHLFGNMSHLPECIATKGDVRIGNDVYVGMNSLILSGVTIGDGAVIGAGSVVTRDVPPYTIVAGNPAREIRRRFDEETIALLQRLRWWDWPLEKIKQHLPLLCSSDLAGLRALAEREAIS